MSNLPFAAEQARSLADRVDRMQAEIDERNADKSEIFKEAKSLGLDVKLLKEAIKLRAKPKAERQEHDTMLGLYMHALGDLD